MNHAFDRAASSGAYSLGAMTEREAADFEKALAESEELRAEVAGFTETAALLASTAPPVEPRPEMKADLLALLDSTPQLPASTGEPAHSADDEDAAPVVAASLDERRERRSAERTRPRALLVLSAAAAAVVLFVGGTLLGGVLTAVSGERTADRFAALNAAPDLVREVTELPDGGTAVVVASAELGMSAVVLNDADQLLPEHKTFQLWYLDQSGDANPAGLMEPEGNRNYAMLEGTYVEGDHIAMTIEPDGGSTQPTTPAMVLLPSSAA
ncbi:MAG: anti-sigma factor [Naasia sp.]|uniref:anti-sigma factor n=1 Tax=Naasia sp. TaxID=2546198 RepID=UPI0026291EB7|nr:anti-sigma factor [Naasia sp.]MCU1571756.1 anti-sigma factor [Naasia sp.]